MIEEKLQNVIKSSDAFSRICKVAFDALDVDKEALVPSSKLVLVVPATLKALQDEFRVSDGVVVQKPSYKLTVQVFKKNNLWNVGLTLSQWEDIVFSLVAEKAVVPKKGFPILRYGLGITGGLALAVVTGGLSVPVLLAGSAAGTAAAFTTQVVGAPKGLCENGEKQGATNPELDVLLASSANPSEAEMCKLYAKLSGGEVVAPLVEQTAKAAAASTSTVKVDTTSWNEQQQENINKLFDPIVKGVQQLVTPRGGQSEEAKAKGFAPPVTVNQPDSSTPANTPKGPTAASIDARLAQLGSSSQENLNKLFDPLVKGFQNLVTGDEGKSKATPAVPPVEPPTTASASAAAAPPQSTAAAAAPPPKAAAAAPSTKSSSGKAPEATPPAPITVPAEVSDGSVSGSSPQENLSKVFDPLVKSFIQLVGPSSNEEVKVPAAAPAAITPEPPLPPSTGSTPKGGKAAEPAKAESKADANGSSGSVGPAGKTSAAAATAAVAAPGANASTSVAPIPRTASFAEKFMRSFRKEDSDGEGDGTNIAAHLDNVAKAADEGLSFVGSGFLKLKASWDQGMDGMLKQALNGEAAAPGAEVEEAGVAAATTAKADEPTPVPAGETSTASSSKKKKKNKKK